MKLKTNFPAREKAISLDLDKLNFDNWVTVDQVIEVIVCYRCKFKIPLQPVKYEGFLDHHDDGKIYLLLHKFHLYVVHYRISEKTCYIADGLNLYLNSETIRTELKSKIDCQNITGIEVRPQTHIDYCGTWAALIALDFSRSHNLGQKPADFVVIPMKLCERIVERLHKFHSEPVYPFTDYELTKDYSILCSCGIRHLPGRWSAHTGNCTLARDHAIDSIVVFMSDRRKPAKANHSSRKHHQRNIHSTLTQTH